MKSKIIKSTYVMGVAFVLTLAGVLFLAPARGVKAEKPDEPGKSNSQAKKLEGTWRAQITIRNCQTGEAVRTFPALVTFANGGTLNATAAGSSPARVSPDYGTWRHTGGSTYSAVSEAFLFSTAGDWTGTQRVTRAIEIGDDPDESTANTSTEIFDVNGNLLATGCATSVARRLE